MKIKYPNKDSFEEVVIYHKTKSIDRLYFLFGKYLSQEDYCKLKDRFENYGFSSIKGIYQVCYQTDRNKSRCHVRYILNDTISCRKEIDELLRSNL